MRYSDFGEIESQRECIGRNVLRRH
jgi:hypothetical protein